MTSAKGHPHTIQDYKILGLVGMGGTSLVYAAAHIGLYQRFGLDRKVALKFIWNPQRAADEVQRLIRLDDNLAANTLLDYHEVRYGDVKSWMDDDFAYRQRELDDIVELQDDDRIAVLVLQFAHGQTITKTVPLADLDTYQPKRDEWLIDVEGEPHRQFLCVDMTLDDRIAMIRGLVRAIRSAHERDPIQIHGDLHPGNVIFDRESGEVVILDWSGEGVFGADGWITPWHDDLVLEEIDKLPPETDIYLLALWIERLLGWDHKDLQDLANRVIKRLEAGEKVSIAQLRTELDTVLNRLQGTKYRRLATANIVIATLLIGFTLWWSHTRADLQERRDQVQVLVDEALNNEARADASVRELKKLLGKDEYQVIRDEVVRGIGTIKLATTKHLAFYETLDLSKPSAVYVSKEQSFVIYDEWPLGIGSPISRSEVILEIKPSGILIGNMKSVERTILFKEHPMLREFGDQLDQRNVFFLYESDLATVILALSYVCSKDLDIQVRQNTTAYGVIIGETPEVVLSKIVQRLGFSWDENRSVLLDLDMPYVGFWSLSKGTYIQGDLKVLLEEMFCDTLGYKMEHNSLKSKQILISQEIKEDVMCFNFFKNILTKNKMHLKIKNKSISVH